MHESVKVYRVLDSRLSDDPGPWGLAVILEVCELEGISVGFDHEGNLIDHNTGEVIAEVE